MTETFFYRVATSKNHINYIQHPKFNKHTYLTVFTCPVTLFFCTATFTWAEMFYKKEI